MQERHYSSALAMELRLSCINSSICAFGFGSKQSSYCHNSSCYSSWFIHNNSLAPGKFGNNYKYVTFNLSLRLHMISNYCEVVFRKMPQPLTDDRSTLVQVMAWCLQATSHYLSQWWPRSMSPYRITRLQWFKDWYPSWTIFYMNWIYIYIYICCLSWSLLNGMAELTQLHTTTVINVISKPASRDRKKFIGGFLIFPHLYSSQSLPVSIKGDLGGPNQRSHVSSPRLGQQFGWLLDQ